MAKRSDFIVVVTGDIVKSRLYSPRERERVQKELLNSWKRVKRFFPEEFRSTLSFRVTAGDEFQYVCGSFTIALTSLTMLRLRMRALGFEPPVTIRAAIGVGTRTVGGSRNSYTQDGPAFRLAREGIERLDKNRLHPLTVVLGLQKDGQTLINDVLALSDRIYAKWTAAQAQVLLQAVALKPPGDIARALKMSNAAVSTHLRRAAWYEYIRVITSIAQDAPFSGPIRS